MLKARFSLTSKFSGLIILVLVLNAAAFYRVLMNVYTQQLKAQAQTVVSNVEAFGAWVAKNGRVWVIADESVSYLSEQVMVSPSDASQKPVHYFSKNPALAQREFSEAVMASTSPAKFRMTSHNVMNPVNAPDAFETRALNAIREQTVNEFAEFSGGNYRYAQAIYHKASCINCHGDADKAPADVIQRYGDKNGFGFKDGDVAGVISVSIPRESLWQRIMHLVGPSELGLVVASLVIALWFIKISIIKPIRILTMAAHDISVGKEVDFGSDGLDANSMNEIDQLTLALGRLKISTQLAIKKMREARSAAAVTLDKARKAIAQARQTPPPQ